MIRKDLVFVDAPFASQDEVLEFLKEQLNEKGLLNNPDKYLAAVKNREREIPTSVGFEVAIPHGRTDAVNESFIAFVRTSIPFLWDERNGEMVRLVFLIGVPDVEGDRTHLRFLSEISRKLMKAEFREQLNQCTTNEEAFALLNEINEKLVKEEQ